ncbi:M15 family metallopeptidase [Cellulomonas sp. Leaf395]|uniref:M15 family metallopeptidase n=1 Tax=Cellulomonas sp. Leaf395 TaxID=1736362 RepID=UPI0012FBEB68|nr:M15 family metallopeptidase [Cellulomonas sp. Leaf395]
MRLAQGAVVTVLALSMCAMVTVSANARDGGTGLMPAAFAPEAAQVERARAGAVDVAADAIEVAQTAQAEGAEVAIDAAELEALQAATARLDELVVEATGDEVTAPRAASRSGEREETPDTEVVTPAAPTPDPAAPTDPATTVDPAAPIDPASVFEQTPAPAPVPLVPPASGKEDATTAELREAVATVATLTTTVRQSAEAKRVADAAAAQAAAEAAAAAAAAQAAADAAAAAAAAQEAQRAAWKQSLLGYSNGRIPDSALCGVSFDASVRLRCDAAEQLDVLNSAYRAQFGTDLVISDSYRSYAGQIACKRTKGYLCAAPGTSNHGSGVAVDLGGGIESFGTKQHRWMAANAPDLSWELPSWAARGGSKPEAWHWEYVG